ncbi:MAG: hypothetical protein K8T90_10215 [Planctomycetes bacterium]|nr:hypothetical protein [Planctomycetota bacterium]
MEQKFRERADRHGGGPVSTGEIDQRVSNEMEQFFAESTEKASRVVPQLDDRPGEGMHETTGEIRRKIDDFFSQVKDAGGGAATPNTQEIQARRPRWQGFFPGQEGAAGSAPSQPAASVPAQSAAPAVARSSDDPPRPTLSRGFPMPPPAGGAAHQPARSYGSPAPSPAVSAARGPSSFGGAPADDDRPKMDLKTALEKLRRHGGSGGASESLAPGAGPVGGPAMSQGAAAPFAPRGPAASITPQRADPRSVAGPAAGSGGGSLSGQRPGGSINAQPSFVPPKREPTIGNIPPIRFDAPKNGPATTSVPVVPPRPEPMVRGAQPGRVDPRAASMNAASQAMPPRREPSTGSLPESRVGSPSPVTPSAAAFSSGAPRREAPQSPTAARAAAPAPAAPQSQAPAPAPRRPVEPPAAQRPQSAPSVRPASTQSPRPQPGFEDEFDASGTGTGDGSRSGDRSSDRAPRPARPASAAAAMRAASVAAAVSRPGMRPPGPAPIDRQLPRVPAAAASASPDADADRPPESPIRVQRRRSVVDVDLDAASATGDEPEAPASRGPSAAAQMYRQSFGGGAPAGRQPGAAPAARPAARPAPSAQPAPVRTERARAASAPSDSGLAFDQIFDELQGLVLDTLRTSVDESFDAARESENELAAAAGLPQAAPLSQPISEDVPRVVSRSAMRPERAVVASPAAEPVAARSPEMGKFERISEEDEPEGDAEVAPQAPYDWGVRKAQRPQGAWLIEGQETGIESAKRRQSAEAPVPMARAAQVPSVPQPAAPSPADSAGGSVGGRSYLVRKLGEQVSRFQPALDALRAKGLVSENDLADPDAPAPKEPSKSRGGDDMLSVDQFAERRPADLERELSPTKLVEDLRRLRRLTDALIAKGLLTEQDLQRPADDE